MSLPEGRTFFREATGDSPLGRLVAAFEHYHVSETHYNLIQVKRTQTYDVCFIYTDKNGIPCKGEIRIPPTYRYDTILQILKRYYG